MIRNRLPSRQARKVLAAFMRCPAEWRHGYDLARQATVSSGTLYPLLIRLHERGLLEARWVEAEKPGKPARHAYRLSAAGRAYAADLPLDEATADRRAPRGVPA